MIQATSNVLFLYLSYTFLVAKKKTNCGSAKDGALGLVKRLDHLA